MFRFPLNDSSKVSSVADWVELHITANATTFSKAELQTALANDASDDFIDSVWSELLRREMLYGPSPPFNVNGHVVENKLDWIDKPNYLACLILSVFGNPDETTRVGELFERLSNEAIRAHLNVETILLNRSPKPSLRDIATLMNETFVKELPMHRIDRGVDIIAWKPFNDNRSSQLVLLIQCASGKHWHDKLRDISLRAWITYINWPVWPIKAFTLARVLSGNSDEFIDDSYDAGIFFDRPRIYRNSQESRDTELKEEIHSWCSEKLSQYSLG